MCENWEDSLDLRELERSLTDFLYSSSFIDNIRSQLAELDMIQSIFYNPGEITIEDKTIVKELTDFVEGKDPSIPRNLDYTVNLKIDEHAFEVVVSLPLEYPIIEPDIHVRCSSYDRHQQSLVNNDLCQFIGSLPRDEPCIFSGITWIQDNATTYIGKEKVVKVARNATPNESSSTLTFTRLWIYSHHIYSKHKRKMMQDLADDFNLSGFCLPGRPGAICFEGAKEDCDECWARVKSMNWKKIVCVKAETESPSEADNASIETLRRFNKFQEVAFEGGKVRGRDCHMDFGAFYKYLVEHNCDYAFKILFGVDGKTSVAQGN